MRKARSRNAVKHHQHAVCCLIIFNIFNAARKKLVSLTEQVTNARFDLDQTTIRAKAYEKGT